MRNTIITSLLATTITVAAAQPVWRCGSSYGPAPCQGGAVVGAPAPVSAAEAARARAVGKADARLADALEQARLQQEKQAPRAVIPVTTPAAAPASKPAAKGSRKGGPELLTAVAPGPKEKKAKGK